MELPESGKQSDNKGNQKKEEKHPSDSPKSDGDKGKPMQAFKRLLVKGANKVKGLNGESEDKEEKEGRQSLRSSGGHGKSEKTESKNDKHEKKSKEGRSSFISEGGKKQRKKRMQFKHLEIVEEIAQGTLGKLFKAKWTKYGMWVALKEIRDVRMSENEEFEKDVRYLRQITLHPNVVRVFGVVEDKKANKVYLVSDFMPLGDLTNFLKTRKSSIDDKARYYMLIGIATGMNHIHNCRLLHQNLSTNNVLVDTNYNVKLSDFGYTDFLAAKLSSASPELFAKRVQQRTVAPEYIESKVWTKKCDVYAFGIMCLEIFGDDLNTHAEPIYVQNLGKIAFPTLPEPVRPIVQACLHSDPNERPSFSRIVDLLEDYYYSTWRVDADTRQEEFIEDLHKQLATKEQDIKSRDQQIQTLMLKVKHLEDQCEVLMQKTHASDVSSPVSGGGSVSVPKKVSAVQDKLLQAWGSKLKMPWDEFVDILSNYMSVSRDEVKDLKYLLAENGTVDKSLWEYLLKWFSPLYPNGVEIDVNTTGPANTFNDMMDVIKPSWFFGFMNPIETNKILLKQPSGTFLFRFSSVPGCYTLSVSNQGQVGHWRIKSEKGPNWTAYWIDERKYDSLTHIIETHLIEPLKVNADRSNQLPIRLEIPYERASHKEEGLYSQFF